MGSNDEKTWDIIASMAIDQILERNENGNLYPLTSTEISVLADIRGLLNPSEEDNTPPEGPQKVPTRSGKPDKKTDKSTKTFEQVSEKDMK